jgi:hypothetical protein
MRGADVVEVEVAPCAAMTTRDDGSCCSSAPSAPPLLRSFNHADDAGRGTAPHPIGDDDSTTPS